MDADAGRVAIVGVELCFGYDNNDESCRQTDCMGDFYGRRAIAAAIPSIVMEDCRGGGWSSWCWCCSCCCSGAVAVGCSVPWRVGDKSLRRSAVVGFVTWNSLRRN